MKSFSFITHFLIFFTFYVQQAYSINCYQCNSNEDTYCAELFNPDELGALPSTCGAIHEANYCIKATGMYEGVIGTYRFCSSRHHGNYCEYVRRPGDDREYRSCVYTCYKDGCNNSNNIMPSAYSILFLILAVLTICHLY